MKIDILKPVLFYDDRCKSDDLLLIKILYSNDNICLGITDISEILLLFDLKTGEVLTSNFMFYYAKNF